MEKQGDLDNVNVRQKRNNYVIKSGLKLMVFERDTMAGYIEICFILKPRFSQKSRTHEWMKARVLLH